MTAVLDLVAETARTLLGFDFCAVLLPDSRRRNLVITGWSGLSAEYVAASTPIGRSASDSGSSRPRAGAVEQGVHDRANPSHPDIAAEPDFTPWGGVAREQGYRAIVWVPLVAGDEVVGTLNGYYTPVHTSPVTRSNG